MTGPTAEIQDPRDHVGLVWLNAERMGRRFETEPGEFAGASYLAMVDAVRTWDHRKGCKFSTHAMPAMKFRAYKTVMYEKGKRRRDTIEEDGRQRSWVDGVKTERVYGDIACRRETPDDSDARRKLDTLLEIAAEVSPWHGAESVRMMARGLDDKQIGRAIGQGPRYGQWLRSEIRKRIANGPRPVKRPQRSRKPIKMDDQYTETADRICKLFRVNPPELGDRHRREAVVSARMFLSHIMHAKGMSFPDIASKMKGTRQHSTIMTATQRLASKMKSGATFEIWDGSQFTRLDGPAIIARIEKVEGEVGQVA